MFLLLYSETSKPFFETIFKPLVLWCKSNIINYHFSIFQHLPLAPTISHIPRSRRILYFRYLHPRARELVHKICTNRSSIQQPKLNRNPSWERRMSGGYSKRDILISLEAHSSHIKFSLPDILEGSLKASCYHITPQNKTMCFSIGCRIF